MSGLVAVAAVVLLATAGSASACCPGDTSGAADITVTRAVETGLHASPTDVGHVVDDSGAIDCGTTCTGTYGWGCTGTVCDYTPVTLTASTLNGWRISRWTGCSPAPDQSTCSLSSAKSTKAVTAYFNDVQDPTVGLNSPPAAGTHIGTGVSLNATAADNDGVSSLTWWYQPAGGAKVASMPGSLASHAFDTSGLAEGTYSFGVDAKDYANRVSSAAVSLVVDHHVAAPVLGGAPADGAWTATPAATVSWSGLDADVTSVQCKLGSGLFSSCSAPWSPALSAGANVLTVGVTDAAGNQNSASRTVNYDGTAPTAGISGSSPTNAPSFALALDGTGSAPTATCWVDAAPTHDSCSGTYAPAGLADGAHTLHVHVVDQAGNAADATKDFTVDTRAPAVDVPGAQSDGSVPAQTPVAPVRAKAINAVFSHRWSVRNRRTSTRTLKLTKLPAGAKVAVRCAGAGRPFASRTLTATAAGVADLHRLFTKTLRAGVTVTITITKPGYAGEVFRFTAGRTLPRPATSHLAG